MSPLNRSARRKIAYGALFAWLTAILPGCSHQVVLEQPDTPPQEPLEPAVPAIATRPFEPDSLYALLVAEFAGERQRFDVMLNNYTQQASATRDPEVVARATRIARYLEAHGPALEMALLWTEVQPESLEAQYNAAAELVHANRLEEAVEHAQRLLQAGEAAGFDAIGAQALQGGDLAVTQRLIASYQTLLTQFPNHAPLHLGLSFLAQHAGNLELALSSARKAQELDETSFQAAGQETRVLQQMGRNDQALAKLGGLAKKHPENKRLQLQYARSLIKTDLAEAQTQFEQLLRDAPDDVDLNLTVALIQFERGLLDDAAKTFQRLALDPERQSVAAYYLGRIALLQDKPEEAIEHFSSVGPGDDYLPAMSQLTDLLLQRNERERALSLVQNQKAATPKASVQQREGLTLLEAHILTSGGENSKALALLESALEENPNSSRLLFTRAMLFTQLDQIAEAEQDFKRLLAINPNDAAALNALGYTLADRTKRLDEAYQYISRAYNLAPDDPAVIDSMGWVEYLRGNHEAALAKLRKAMSAMPDPEIAAHLGEVLWVTGNQEEARKVWQQGLTLEPNSGVILKTLKRLQTNLN